MPLKFAERVHSYRHYWDLREQLHRRGLIQSSFRLENVMLSKVTDGALLVGFNSRNLSNSRIHVHYCGHFVKASSDSPLSKRSTSGQFLM